MPRQHFFEFGRAQLAPLDLDLGDLRLLRQHRRFDFAERQLHRTTDRKARLRSPRKTKGGRRPNRLRHSGPTIAAARLNFRVQARNRDGEVLVLFLWLGYRFVMDRELRDAIKGRGAVSNAGGRYEPTVSEAVDDGWAQATDETDPPPLETVLIKETSRSIITTNDSPDVGFDRSINPYRGCEHGCIYCYARPAHAYAGLSSGLDFETRIFFKPDAARLLEAAFAKKSYVPRSIALGSNTDPYQPSERKLQITRGLLQVFAKWNHPLSIVTKNALVLRDLDLLGELAAKNLVGVAVSVTTLDRGLARTMEPRASTPAKRLEAIAALSRAGVPVTVMAAPMIPALNDHELERILEAAAQAGAKHAAMVFVRLPREIADLFQEWLHAHVPDRAERVMSLIRQSRGGAAYESNWGVRMTGTGPYAETLQQRFEIARRKFGLDAEWKRSDTSLFRAPPSADAATVRQLDLFG
jgi:DNA repair photolyase